LDEPEQAPAMSIRGERVALVLLLVGLLNFALFVTGSIVLGGDAVNGKIEDGQYYVGGKGLYFAVSPGVWIYSYIHVISVWITFPVAMFGGVAYFRARHRHSQRGRPTPRAR
jgi:hypothetical protein